MSPLSKCVSKQTAERLKAAGWTAETEHWWETWLAKDGTPQERLWCEDKRLFVRDMLPDADILPAPDATEIMELLPDNMNESKFYLEIAKVSGEWWCGYYTDNDNPLFDLPGSKTMAEACALCWLFLKEQGLI